MSGYFFCIPLHFTKQINETIPFGLTHELHTAKQAF